MLNNLNVNIQELKQLMPVEARTSLLDQMTDQQYIELKYDWKFWARKEQLQPDQLGKNGVCIWFAKAGRGFGKTRMFAEWIIDKIKNEGYKKISLAGAAADEVREIMIEGESGLLACSPPWFMPKYEPSKKRITWPNGAIASIFYGSEADKSRGAQSDLIWCDEIAKWQYPEETFDNLMLGLRLGNNPLCAVSSTPRPTKFIQKLMKRNDVVITGGSTYDNKANLAHTFMNSIIQKYEGTRMGRQELYAAILDDNPNALWKREWIDENRIMEKPDCPRLIVAIDPQAASGEDEETAETGIVVAGEGRALPGMRFPELTHYYVFEDSSLSSTPEKWARVAITGANKYKADRIVAEKNNGGEMVKSTLHNVDQTIPVSLVWASRGKYTRAEPISALYEQGRVHHIGNFADLEDQLCEWIPGEYSPDRLDALVWAITWLAEKDINVPAPNIWKQRTREKSKSIIRNLPT